MGDAEKQPNEATTNAEKSQVPDLAQLQRSIAAMHKRFDKLMESKAEPVAPRPTGDATDPNSEILEKLKRLEADNKVLQRERDKNIENERRSAIEECAKRNGADPKRIKFLLNHLNDEHGKRIKYDRDSKAAYYEVDKENDTDLDSWMGNFLSTSDGEFFKPARPLPRGNGLRSNGPSSRQSSPDVQVYTPQDVAAGRVDPQDILSGKARLA